MSPSRARSKRPSRPGPGRLSLFYGPCHVLANVLAMWFNNVMTGIHGSPVLKKDRPCSTGCGRLVGLRGARGLCPVCYQRARNAELKADPLTCEVPGCGQDVVHQGNKICAMHRARLRREGSVGEADRRNVPAGEWHVNSKGYRSRIIEGKEVLEHRLIMGDLLGRDLKRHETAHHMNGQRADNSTDGPLVGFRSGNLELWSSWQPPGQRVVDKIQFAVSLLKQYAPEMLAR